MTLRLGFLCPHNPHDRRAFSGSAYFAARALRRTEGVDLRILGHRRDRFPGLRTKLERVFPRRPLAASTLDPAGLDAVVGLVATPLLDALLDRGSAVPLVHVTDATPGFLRDFYGDTVPDAAVAAEARVVQGAARTVYSSHFMAEQAAREFGSGIADRLAVVPFGVNLDRLPATLPRKSAPDPLKLLYVGTDWQRKGGDLALAAFEHLRAQGIAAELTLAGGLPEGGVAARDGLSVAGFLDKNDPAQAARFNALMAEAHVFVLPTRADCTPMVVAEANAYGTPVLITETGGIGTLMEPGVNGTMLPPAAGAEAWARAILDLTRDADAYAAMSKTSFGHARARLSWEVWARDVARIAAGLRR